MGLTLKINQGLLVVTVNGLLGIGDNCCCSQLAYTTTCCAETINGTLYLKFGNGTNGFEVLDGEIVTLEYDVAKSDPDNNLWVWSGTYSDGTAEWRCDDGSTNLALTGCATQDPIGASAEACDPFVMDFAEPNMAGDCSDDGNLDMQLVEDQDDFTL